MERLDDIVVHPPQRARVVVMAASDPPRRGAWNVQVFHGLGDKGYTLNPIFLQRRRFPRVRTAGNMLLKAVGARGPFLRPPAQPGRRATRYQQLNAYGPRWADLLEGMVEGAVVSRHGHLALNEMEGLGSDPDGPILWMPTWDNSRFLGGPNQSSLATVGDEVIRLARATPFLVKLHPLSVLHRQEAALRSRLESAEGVTLAPADASPYELMEGARALLTDTSSLGFEAYCAGLPVAVVRNPGVAFHGIHQELAERTPVLEPGGTDLARWVESPEPPSDAAWARDLLFEPSRARNDRFAAELRRRATGGTG